MEQQSHSQGLTVCTLQQSLVLWVEVGPICPSQTPACDAQVAGAALLLARRHRLYAPHPSADGALGGAHHQEGTCIFYPASGSADLCGALGLFAAITLASCTLLCTYQVRMSCTEAPGLPPMHAR